VELVPFSVAKYTTVGSTCTASNKGALLYYSASGEELKEAESALRVPCEKGTINGGAGFVGMGMVHNANGFAAGEGTTGFELGKVAGALGYVK
ncbi:MAG: translation initiation factor IF-6, partial [Candidatus ainarchaeum sp.]|nr:translation initiation factor IF-6 [Candidatus ainarchaeum sp.]